MQRNTHTAKIFAEVKGDLREWVGFRWGRASMGDGWEYDLDEIDRVRAIETPADAVRFYLETATHPHRTGWTMHQRWQELYREYRRRDPDGYTSAPDLVRKMVYLFVDAEG